MKNIILTICLLILPFTMHSEITISLIGDSNTYGWPNQEEGWVHLLQEDFYSRNYPIRLINLGQCGMSASLLETSLLKTISKDRPKIVILNVGIVDIVYLMDLKLMKSAIQRMIETCLENKIVVLFGKMEVSSWRNSRGYDPVYLETAEKIYKDFAENYPIISYPFINNELISDPLYQNDHLHPNLEGHKKIYEVIREKLFEAFISMQNEPKILERS